MNKTDYQLTCPAMNKIDYQLTCKCKKTFKMYD